MTRQTYLQRCGGPAKVLRVASVSILAGAGVLSGFAPSFSASKPMGKASATPNPLADTRLYVDPSSNARRYADQLRSKRPADARALDIIA